MGYLHEEREAFKEAVNITAYQTGITPQVVEKDYYVTMILRRLSVKMPFVVFKGGTSLSKCYKLIKRFSEDIDITVDISLTQGQKKKLKCAIVDIAKELGLSIANLEETRSRRDYNRYVIGYDPIMALDDSILLSAVLIETSFTAISFPVNVMPVDNYIGQMMRGEAPESLEKYALEPFEMKVQGIDRTLADKIFAVCDYYLQGKVSKHSRHIYDIYKLLPLVPQNDKFKELLQAVREARKPSVICPSAQEIIDIPSLLQRIIDEDVYKSDYQRVTEHLLEEVVHYDTAIGALKEIAGGEMFQ